MTKVFNFTLGYFPWTMNIFLVQFKSVNTFIWKIHGSYVLRFAKMSEQLPILNLRIYEAYSIDIFIEIYDLKYFEEGQISQRSLICSRVTCGNYLENIQIYVTYTLWSIYSRQLLYSTGSIICNRYNKDILFISYLFEMFIFSVRWCGLPGEGLPGKTVRKF